ncbi:reverse transcriptase-like protein [Cytobacillus praedii]|uniref:Reverse transcriptase-like protein n=1 Tax=Cytobacillus praedii TaxID=1742358 RepID=A0A4V2NUQ4_9BACI|nr:reverse transcriptase-like protein [Cytobacillus praedii]MED3572035.1 reverse transcriptase-like protein [Cytobacillus praedii]TCJ05421.1 reverse transcriptase-like protein [Cytobacillus praedii]
MKYKLEWKYKLKGTEGTIFTSEWLEGEAALQIGEDLEKSGKASDLIYHDERGTTWITKEMKKLLEEIEEDPHDLTIYFDGGFNKKTSQAGLGAVIYFKQGKKKYRIRANELFDEIETNSEAEYAAMYYTVNLLEEMGVHHMTCEFKGDAQGVLMQLKGEWPCYEENLNRWLDRIEEKLKALKVDAKFTPIPRTENKEADKLATQALEGKEINSKMQII